MNFAALLTKGERRQCIADEVYCLDRVCRRLEVLVPDPVLWECVNNNGEERNENRVGKKNGERVEKERKIRVSVIGSHYRDLLTSLHLFGASTATNL